MTALLTSLNSWATRGWMVCVANEEPAQTYKVSQKTLWFNVKSMEISWWTIQHLSDEPCINSEDIIKTGWIDQKIVVELMAMKEIMGDS